MTEETYPPVPQKYQDQLLLLLANCGFIENPTHTANTFTPINPMNLPRAYHRLREFILDIEKREGSETDKVTVELEQAVRQHERMEKIQK